MTTISRYTDCGTAGCRALDLQLIAQIQVLQPGLLISISHLPLICGSGCHAYLQAPAAVALGKAIKARGVEMLLNSCYRTLAQQAILYAHCCAGRCGIRAASKPGLSNHNTGLAIDIEDAAGWKPYLQRFGWWWIGSFDPMHFDFRGGGVKDMRHLSTKAFQQLWNRHHPKDKIAEDGQWGPITQSKLMASSVNGFSTG